MTAAACAQSRKEPRLWVCKRNIYLNVQAIVVTVTPARVER